MKVIYLWIDKFRNIEKQGFSFGADFEVEYKITSEERKLSIRRSENKLCLFGDKVIDITAIIGENGSGKSNLLDLLGFRMTARLNHAHRTAEYFVLYHMGDNQFVIEGNNFEKMGLFDVSQRVASYYSIVATLGDDDSLTFVRFLQEKQENQHAAYINFRHKFNQYWSNRSFQLEEEPNHFFQRYAFNQMNSGIYSKYRFIRDSLSQKSRGSTSNFFQVSPNTHISIKLRTNEETKAGLNFKADNLFDDLTSLLESDTNSADEKKDYFILSFLENACHGLFRECVTSSIVEEAQLQSKIDKVPLNEDKPSIYLLDVLKVLGETWDRNSGLDREFFDCLKEMYEYLKKLPEGVFSSDRIRIKVHGTEIQEVTDFLKYLQSAKSASNNSVVWSFEIDIEPFSSGEEAFLTLFSSLHYAITSVSNAENKTCIILLDEPDSFMHPEWSRIIISRIIDYLGRTPGGYKAYQVVLTTHSPFIISDLPKQNLVALRKNKETDKSEKAELNSLPETFASNIHTLLSNEFFMNDTIGEFAKQKLNCIIDQLKRKISGEKLGEKCLEYEKTNIKQWIEMIGEPLIKNQMHQLFVQAFPTSRKEVREKRLQSLKNEIAVIEREKSLEGTE
ncbi:AAA family ATPase [Shouchella shacheensis]|uniref:AAA family ATPase n=1 Tax=Shouchella shacheensis TaxID=1649580 RepID=UPI0007401356|nr:AAA family ATPase [Shouchella shacheensis]